MESGRSKKLHWQLKSKSKIYEHILVRLVQIYFYRAIHNASLALLWLITALVIFFLSLPLFLFLCLSLRVCFAMREYWFHWHFQGTPLLTDWHQ